MSEYWHQQGTILSHVYKALGLDTRDPSLFSTQVLESFMICNRQHLRGDCKSKGIVGRMKAIIRYRVSYGTRGTSMGTLSHHNGKVKVIKRRFIICRGSSLMLDRRWPMEWKNHSGACKTKN